MEHRSSHDYVPHLTSSYVVGLIVELYQLKLSVYVCYCVTFVL